MNSDMIAKSYISVCVWLAAVVLVVAAPPRHRSSTPPQAVVVNGTQVNIGYMQEAFVFCMAQVEPSHQLHQVQVQWRRASAGPVHSWSQNNRFVFSLGGGSHLPHQYLVFHDFTSEAAGDYTCGLLYEDSLAHSATLTVAAR